MEPGGTNNTQVYIDGVYQQKDTYSLSGAVVTFSTAPPNLSTFEVMVIEALPVGANTASQVSFTQAGSTYNSNVQLKLQESVSVKDFGAVGDGVNDDTAAIQAAINAANGLYFPYGTYLVSAQINLKSNLSITADIGAKILLDTGVTPYVLRGTSISNVSIVNLEIEGNGASGYSTIYIDNSSNIYINNCKITKSGSTGLYFVFCLFVKVENCELSNNYYYGLEFRDCDGCKAFANLCAENGDTGVATSAGGRGIMLWRSRSCYIAGNRLSLNTEYGFRIYSEAADTTTSNYNVVTGNVFLDNTACDFLLYDEGAAFSFVSRNTISDNVVYRTTNTTLGAIYTLHGDNNTFVNNHAFKSGTFGTDAAFNFYNANYCTISNCSAENVAQAFSTSSSTNITIDNCFGNGVANGLTIPTENIFVTNCRFIHGGTGTTDSCIDNTTATGKNFYRDNHISGFYRGFSIDDKLIALFRNTTLSSSNAGLNKSGNVTSTIEAGDNSWDSASPFLLSAFSRTSSTHDQAEVRYTGAPTTLTWIRGDIVYNEEPSASGSIGFVCVTGGTPGTWKTFGAISA
jgi:parallel beta-helix repeat protein